jgi:hypothetical protein
LVASVYLASAISSQDVAARGRSISALATGLVMSVLLPAASHARSGARLHRGAADGPLPGGAPPECQSRPAVNRGPADARDHGRRLAELFTDAKLVEIEDSYTLIPEDQPERLAREPREFVKA